MFALSPLGSFLLLFRCVAHTCRVKGEINRYGTAYSGKLFLNRYHRSYRVKDCKGSRMKTDVCYVINILFFFSSLTLLFSLGGGSYRGWGVLLFK